MASWMSRLAGKPRLYAIDYRNDPGILDPQMEATWAKFPLLIVFSDMQQPLVEHRARIRALNPTQVLLAYIATNHAQPPTQVCGVAERDMIGADPFMHFADGSIPMADCGPDHDYCKLYDYRTDAWRTMFLESARESLYIGGFDGLFFDNCNVWTAALENNNQTVRRQMLEALQDAISTLRGRYPSACLIGNSDVRFAGLNGEMVENRPPDFKAALVPFQGHAQPEMNLCQLYETTEVNVLNAYKYVSSHGGWFGAQADCFTPQWFPFFGP
jgi:hypothetical protein